MKIKSKLQTIIIFTLVVFPTIIISNLWWQKQDDRLIEKEKLVRELHYYVFEKAQVRDEYFMHGEERAKVQWVLMYKKLQGLLDRMSLTFTDEDEKVVLSSFYDFYNKTGKLFEQLIRYDEGVKVNDAVSGELREMLVSRMMVISHSQYPDVLKLQNIINEKAEHQHKLLHLYANIAYGLLAALIVSFVVILIRGITYPLAKLQEGTEIIAKGNLDHKTNIRTNDEIGQLSAAVDVMTESLKAITVSRDELSKEIKNRRKAEEELKDYREHLEELVKQRTFELEAINGELEGFSYSVSHDLRAPLRYIIGFVELLNKRSTASLDEKSRHYLQVISDSASQMGRLVDDLLSFSRTGRVDMLKTKINLEKIVTEALDTLRTETEGRDIVWRIKTLPEVYSDPAMMRMVMINLISNAIKFTRPRPQAEIEIGCMPDNSEEEVFYVRDNGVGFDMKYVDKLFNLFQRLHHIQEFEGTGLGLANVRRIIHRHGGRTWAEAVLNEGAAFYFSLPK